MPFCGLRIAEHTIFWDISPRTCRQFQGWEGPCCRTHHLLGYFGRAVQTVSGMGAPCCRTHGGTGAGVARARKAARRSPALCVVMRCFAATLHMMFLFTVGSRSGETSQPDSVRTTQESVRQEGRGWTKKSNWNHNIGIRSFKDHVGNPVWAWAGPPKSKKLLDFVRSTFQPPSPFAHAPCPHSLNGRIPALRFQLDFFHPSTALLLVFQCVELRSASFSSPSNVPSSSHPPPPAPLLILIQSKT